MCCLHRCWMILAAFVAIAAPSMVEASCLAMPPKVIWSYPGNGATVPPNAVFWAIVPLGNDVRALLDGVEIGGPEVAFNGGRFEPGTLSPGAHTIEFIVGSRGSGEVLVPVEFTVAGDPAVPATGSVTLDGLDLEARGQDLSSMCQEVVGSHDCYDTGQDAQVLFETKERPLVWIIGRGADPSQLQGPVLWPGECGPPRLVTHSNLTTCVSAQAIDETGTARPSNEVCTDGCGCASGSGALLLPAWLLVLGMRRRATRAATR